MQEDNYRIFLIEHDGKIVGKAHLRTQDNLVFLADLAVSPSMQGHGVGTKLINYCITTARIEKYTALVLDVETHNQKALNLYKRLGFHISNQHDYWKTLSGIHEFGLTSFLHGN